MVGGVRRRNDSELGCVNWALGYAAAPCYLERSSGNASKSIKAEHPKFPLVARSGPTWWRYEVRFWPKADMGDAGIKLIVERSPPWAAAPLHAGQPPLSFSTGLLGRLVPRR